MGVADRVALADTSLVCAAAEGDAKSRDASDRTLPPLASGCASRLGRVPRVVLSIAAAPGWAARYVDENGEKVVTLLAWALVEDGLTRDLVGFVQKPAAADEPQGSVVLADEVEGFAGYTAGALNTRTTVLETR